jgi:hypothetical protein
LPVIAALGFNGTVDAPDFRYLLSIRSPHPVGDSVQVEQLFRAAYMYDNCDDDGHVYDGEFRAGFIYESHREFNGGHPLGRYSFTTVERVHAAYPQASWLAIDHSEPSIGSVRGFLNFEWWTDDVDARSCLIAEWFRYSNGYLVDLATGTVFDSLTRRSWPLAEVLSKYGFDDGDFFLNRPPEYFAMIRRTLADALVRASVDAKFVDYGPLHNPMRVDYRSGDALLKDAVADQFVDLWGFDCDLLDHPRFQHCVLRTPSQRPG